MSSPYPHYFSKYISALETSLSEVCISDIHGNTIPQDEGFQQLCNLSAKTGENGRTQFICGNGASAAFANHMALDWTKNGKVRTVSVTSSAIITAVGNDMGFDESFATSIEWYGEAGDLLITISSSGNSSNVIKAIETARQKGLKVITLSGLRPENRSREMGDLNVYVPAKTYGMVECAHQVILHVWLDLFMGIEEWERNTFQNMNAESFQL